MSTVRKRGNSWQLIAYAGYDELGRQIRKSRSISAIGVSKAQAEREAALFEKDVLRKGGKVNNMTVSGILDYWWENYGNMLSPTTIDRNKTLCRRIYNLLGHIRAHKLAPKHIHLFIKELQKPNARRDGKALSSSSIAMHYKFLSAVLSKAVKWDLLAENPCLRVDTPKIKSELQPIFQEKDLSRFIYLLLTTAPLRYQVFFMLAFTDGLRRSEICGLDEKSIDFEKNIFKIECTAIISRGKVIYRNETKTKNSAAVMTLSPILSELLKKYIQERRNEESRLNIPYRSKLFTNTENKPYYPSSFTRWLHNFLKANAFPKVNTQGFRKMAITYAMRKINLKEASQFGRHTNISTTARYYSEVLESRLATPTMYLDTLIHNSLKSGGEKID